MRAMIKAGHRARMIQIAAQLGIADILAHGPADPVLLAEESGCDAEALSRLLRALAASGVFTRTTDGAWQLTQHMEELRGGWAREADPAKRKAINEQLQLEAMKMVGVVPLGQFYIPTAYRSSLKDFLAVPVPVMWGVTKQP